MKTAIDFMRDLEEVQNVLVSFNSEVDAYYSLVERNTQKDALRLAFVDGFLEQLNLEQNEENRLAVITRLVSLRDDSLVQALKKAGKTEKEITLAREQAYLWVKAFYMQRQGALIEALAQKNLLTPFYRQVMRHWHEVGQAMNGWQSEWTSRIIEGVNKELSQQFEGDDAKVNQYLLKNSLIDKGHGGSEGDRCYSVLQKEGNVWKSIAYVDAFPAHVRKVIESLRDMKEALEQEEDNTFHEKRAWIQYVDSLVQAFSETRTDHLIAAWADVDRAWMGITSPIQPAHPLEYYEDHYRKAVALEWDIRISNPEHSSKGIRKDKVKRMSIDFYDQSNLGTPAFQKIRDFAVDKLDTVQLHIGRVGLFYGADLCGLPSAQVVPNDEVVSREFGKKIFAFPDNILQTQRSRPFVRLSREVFPQSFLSEERKVLFQDRILWFKIYDISTIGHEYGHILWVDEDSEAVMNQSGNFKNVEEWKATTGGLMAFFMDSDPLETTWKLRKHVLADLVKRSLGLIAWKEASEVLPYYCEALIHLQGLFDAKVLGFDVEAKKLSIDISPATFEALSKWYADRYRELAFNYYLPKNDPTPFLQRFALKEEKVFMPVDKTIHALSLWYWDLYLKYGREVDTEDCRENYLI